ncbi:MAG: hypothetical protein KBG30_05620 [Bacteroidales bacterium]|nr:hypothetical protein [Bacteroidales bacterium]
MCYLQQTPTGATGESNGNTVYGQKADDILPELLSKEFLKQFKTEEDVSKFLTHHLYR